MEMAMHGNIADGRELSSAELDTVDGGVLPLLVGAAVLAVMGIVGMAYVVADATPAFIHHMTDSGSNVK